MSDGISNLCGEVKENEDNVQDNERNVQRNEQRNEQLNELKEDEGFRSSQTQRLYWWSQYKNPDKWNFHLPWAKDVLSWKGKFAKMSGDLKELAESVHRPSPDELNMPEGAGVRALWIGHASLLVQIDGCTILTDPVFSDIAGPGNRSFVGYKRYRPPAITVEEISSVDVVLISHDHYDHFDRASVKQLADKFKNLTWLVPKGGRNLCYKEGCQNIVEFEWWDTHILPNNARITFTPAKHWSWRVRSGRNQCLWGSWVVEGSKGSKFFFAGDTGYEESLFQKIGEVFGPFDLAAIPIGAYEPRSVMKCQHVDPEEAVKIHRDIKSKHSMGIHWGTFFLSDEDIDDPPEKLKKAIKDLDFPFEAVQHGTFCPSSKTNEECNGLENVD